MARNAVTYYRDATLVRSAEVPAADWTGGMNRSGSNAPGIGINTGAPNPKPQDWWRDEETAPRRSQHLGQDKTDLNAIIGADVNEKVAFVTVDVGGAANGAAADLVTGGVNVTGEDLLEGDWVWSVVPVA